MIIKTDNAIAVKREYLKIIGAKLESIYPAPFVIYDIMPTINKIAIFFSSINFFNRYVLDINLFNNFILISIYPSYPSYILVKSY